MMSLLKASFFLLTISPLAQACTKLMDGKDKTENKKEIVELLRKLADMLEEQTPITPGEPIVDKTTSVDHYPVFDPYPVDDIGNPNWRNPERYSPRDSTTRNVGHPPAFGIGIVKDCALWDDGSCGAKAAKDQGLRCKNFWANQMFEESDERYQRIQGIENPMFLRVKNGIAKSRGDALKMCEDVCLANPSCEGFNFEENAWGCYFVQGFEKLQRISAKGFDSVYCKPMGSTPAYI